MEQQWTVREAWTKGRDGEPRRCGWHLMNGNGWAQTFAKKKDAQEQADHQNAALLVNQLRKAAVGDKVRFAEERLAYTIQARSERFLVCNKPFNARRTVLYCIVDLLEKIRGPEGVVFGLGAETREECEAMLSRIEAGAAELAAWDVPGVTLAHPLEGSEISFRHRAPLCITAVIAATKAPAA